MVRACALLWAAMGVAVEANLDPDLANGLTFFVYGLNSSSGGYCHEIQMGERVRQVATSTCTTHECCAGLDFAAAPNPIVDLGSYRETVGTTVQRQEFRVDVGSACPSTYRTSDVVVHEATDDSASVSATSDNCAYSFDLSGPAARFTSGAGVPPPPSPSPPFVTYIPPPAPSPPPPGDFYYFQEATVLDWIWFCSGPPILIFIIVRRRQMARRQAEERHAYRTGFAQRMRAAETAVPVAFASASPAPQGGASVVSAVAVGVELPQAAVYGPAVVTGTPVVSASAVRPNA